VASIFGNAFGDADGIPVGVAVTGLTGTSLGSWQYSTSGGTAWINFPAVSTSAALLLSASDLIRFVPSKSFTGSVTVQAYAWDGSTGTPGSAVNLSKTGIGGSTAFSSTSLFATCAVNTAPC
jgi:hypothetical protein